jgi:hypothetical protein
MPQENPTPVNQGQGSVSPTFTAPSVDVVTPSLSLQAEPTEQEQFLQAVLAAGRGVASAVSARSAINSRLRTLKEQSVARVERDLARSARHLQEKRLNTALRDRQQILVDAESRGLEYAERRFRSAMLNSSSAEESQVWEQAWTGVRGQIDRSNEEARQQQFNHAARTMEQTSLLLQEQLAQDPTLEATLIGDGRNISSRVQDWMLTEIGNAVDLDSMTEDDADVLIHQAIKQSFRISDQLRGVHEQRVETTNELLGTEQIQADLFATLSGEQDASRLGRQLSITFRDRLNHLTPEQQRDFLRRSAEAQLISMADGTFGVDFLDNLGTAANVLSLAVDGVPVFGEADRQAIAAEMLTRAQRTATREVQAEIFRLQESQSDIITLPGGRVIRRPATNPAAAMVAFDPETESTPIDRVGDKILSDMGLLGDIEEMSPEAVAIVSTVRTEIAKFKADLMSESNQRFEDVSNANTVFSGQPGGDANDAHRYSFERRAHMDSNALSADKQRPLSGVELDVFKSQLRAIAENLEEDSSVINEWNGDTVDYSDENVELNRFIAINEARKWSNSNTQAQYGMPSDLVRDKVALLSSNDPNRVKAFADWALHLDAGNNEAWDNFLTAEGVDANTAAAAQWVRVHARLGQPQANITPDYTALMSQVQAIQNAIPVTGWFRSDTGDVELDTSNAGNMAQIMADIISDESSAEFEGSDQDRFNRRVQAQLQQMFVSDTNSTGRMLRQLWFAGRAVNTDLNDEQIGSMVWSWLKKDGHRFREINGRAVLVQDPQGYTGQQGQSITEHVDNNFVRPFQAFYRAFLGEALDVPLDQIPQNLQDMFIIGEFGTDQGIDPYTPYLQPRWSLNEQVTDRLLDARANYGGFVIQAQRIDGTILPLPTSVRDATITWPDGTEVFVPKGDGAFRNQS